jgi:PAS domain-containing protein
MPQRELEIILARQLAEHLVMPIFIVDPAGNLLFYNEPAESILGTRYDETGMMSVQQWATIFKPVDSHGHVLLPEDLPLVIATTKQRPAHRRFWIEGLDGKNRQIDVTAFPLVNQTQRFLGAIALFWEVPD